MEKKDIQRENVHDMHMKSVILRLDYTGVANINTLIDAFDAKYKTEFPSRQSVSTREVSVALRKEDLNAISKAVMVPVNIIEKERIWQYKGLQGVNGIVTLCISQYYTYMSIEYKDNYDGLSSYLSYFIGAITTFKEKEQYLCPQRFGIRKCRVQDFEIDQIGDMDKTFESFVFNDPNLPIGKIGRIPRQYRTCLCDDSKNNIKVIVQRQVGYMENEHRKEICHTSLDIDVYYDNQEYLNCNPPENIIKVVNDMEFDVYKMCMTKEYLNGGD